MNTPLKWSRLDCQALLRFSGLEAITFLNAQLTSDVKTLSPTHTQYSGYCTPKGRLLCSMLLWHEAESVFMMLPAALAEAIQKRLTQYILRAKVKIEALSDQYVMYVLSGKDSDSFITAQWGIEPLRPHETTLMGAIRMLKLPIDRHLIVCPKEEASLVQVPFENTGPSAEPSHWDLLDIEAGIASIGPITQEQFVPQNVNFDCIGAVSFNKGCYPGQEIVARTHFLGTVKQRLIRAQLQTTQTTQTPQIGDKLYSPTFGEQVCGQVVSVVHHPDHTHDLLVVLQTASINKNDATWGQPNGIGLHCIPTPYPIPS